MCKNSYYCQMRFLRRNRRRGMQRLPDRKSLQLVGEHEFLHHKVTENLMI